GVPWRDGHDPLQRGRPASAPGTVGRRHPAGRVYRGRFGMWEANDVRRHLSRGRRRMLRRRPRTLHQGVTAAALAASPGWLVPDPRPVESLRTLENGVHERRDRFPLGEIGHESGNGPAGLRMNVVAKHRALAIGAWPD